MDRAETDPTDPELIDIWQQALDAISDLLSGLEDDQWDAQTPCPGWTVADVAAHLVDIELLLAGRPRPVHQPDWDALPHATGDISRLTEVGVDFRRGQPRGVVLGELADVIPTRRAQLDAIPEGAAVVGPRGNPTTVERLLRMRTFDIWVHEQDVRAAVGRDGDWASGPARIAFQQMTRSLPHVWQRSVEAPIGSTVHVEITGPDLGGDLYAEIDPDGSGRPCGTVLEPTVTLTLSWPDYMRLAAGRIPVDDPGLRSRIRLSGDEVLGEALLTGLTITP